MILHSVLPNELATALVLRTSSISLSAATSRYLGDNLVSIKAQCSADAVQFGTADCNK